MAKKTILVVEDNEDMQFMYKDILGGNYNLSFSGNTGDAMQKIHKKMPDLMILDIILPGESGDTFLAKLRENSKFEKIKVLCITVLGNVSAQMKLIDPKVECIPKPFGKEELLNKVKEMLK